MLECVTGSGVPKNFGMGPAYHCDFTVVEQHRFLLSDTLGILVTGIPIYAGAFDALRDPASLCDVHVVVGAVPHRCAIRTALSTFMIVRLRLLIIPRCLLLDGHI